MKRHKGFSPATIFSRLHTRSKAMYPTSKPMRLWIHQFKATSANFALKLRFRNTSIFRSFHARERQSDTQDEEMSLCRHLAATSSCVIEGHVRLGSWKAYAKTGGIATPHKFPPQMPSQLLLRRDEGTHFEQPRPNGRVERLFAQRCVDKRIPGKKKSLRSTSHDKRRWRQDNLSHP